MCMRVCVHACVHVCTLLKLNYVICTSKVDCDLYSYPCTPTSSHCRSTSGPPPPPCRLIPGPTSHSPASLSALWMRSTSPQPTHASPDYTCQCTPQNICSEQNCCKQSQPKCLGLCSSIYCGQLTCMYTWLRPSLIMKSYKLQK